MWILLTAVLTASLLGSMHCVGMCGPLAIWASGAGASLPRSTVWFASSLYHLGRLITYLIAGTIAGAIGGFVELGGNAIGVQVAAARVVGVVMVGIGAWKLWRLYFGHQISAVGGSGSRIGGLLVRLRPLIFRLPPGGRALATGLLTTLLPCGWLYLFALVAAGTGRPVLGTLVMLAFWIGTVPALVSLVAGTQLLSRRFTRAVPIGAAVLLIVTGCFTAGGRGFAGLTSLAWINDPAVRAFDPEQEGVADGVMVGTIVQQLREQDLPCCTGSGSRPQPPTAAAAVAPIPESGDGRSLPTAAAVE